MRDATLCLKLNPIVSRKPRVTLEAACDVARRIGCYIEIAVNDVPVIISPVAGKGDVFQRWSDTATSRGTPSEERTAG